MKKIFIDGSSGTTGLRIHERLAGRKDIRLITLPEALRKDPIAVKIALNDSDIAFLCLPDRAATEAVGLVENPDTVILDTSTAHRTTPGWVYGFPEISDGQAQTIQKAKRIAVPGCHASGFIALAKPLVEAGYVDASAYLSCFSLTGYSGGGKAMIAQYEAPDRSPLLQAPRQYGIAQQHKHLKEMQALTGLAVTPGFCPIVADFYSGMEVSINLSASLLQNGADAQSLRALYAEKYHSPLVYYREAADEEGFLSAAALSGKDCMEISVSGNAERILLTARYDNLGKGASGAALECLNLVMGLPPETGLVL